MTRVTAVLLSLSAFVATSLGEPNGDYTSPGTAIREKGPQHYPSHWNPKTGKRPSCPSKPSGNDTPTKIWPGWDGIEYMFVFGESYTQTGFNTSLAQPNPANPLGNPDYPGYTATNGPNWVDFLTTTYNATFLQTINLASGGATVDSALVEPYAPTVLSLIDQVQTEYLPIYSDSPDFFSWIPNNTLFAAFFGINDIGNSYANANSTLYTQIFAKYAEQTDVLYQSGARNFLFLNVPPVDRSPLTAEQGPEAQALESSVIQAFNQNVTTLAENLTSTYADATAFVFNTHELFTQVLDEPCSWPETCAYRNTTGFCDACKSSSKHLKFKGTID